MPVMCRSLLGLLSILLSPKLFFANLPDSIVNTSRKLAMFSSWDDKIPKHFDNDGPLLCEEKKWSDAYRLTNKLSQWWEAFRVDDAIADGGGRIFSPFEEVRVEKPTHQTIGNSINFYCNFITFNYCFENGAFRKTFLNFRAEFTWAKDDTSRTITQLGLWISEFRC